MQDILDSQQLLGTYTDVFDNITEGIIISDDDNKIIHVNKACENITGYTKEEVIGKNPRIFSSEKNENIHFENIWQIVKDQKCWTGELWNARRDGTIYPILIKIYRFTNTQTNKTNYYAIFSDLSISDESNDDLFHLAYHDPLTNLPNRLKLKAQLEYVISNSKRNDLKFAILFLDLDDFKLVNDCLGHSSGDEVLVSFANKFKNIVRSNDMVARVGGDEFIIVLSDISNYLFVERVCNKILSILSKPMKISDIEFNLGVSIGVAVYPDNGEDIDRLISNADSAMYHAKENGKNNFEFYSEEMNKKLVEFSQREKELLDAIRNDEFIIHFQPEIDTHTNEVFSLEVLTRWNNKAKGLLLPGHFISDLESTNYIFEFEELIIEKACKQLKIWHDANIYKGTISVNITGKYLEYGNLYESIGNILVRTGLRAEFLELEFNESDVMKISTKTLFTLSNLSHLGVGLAIDNFGKGFSSFNYLKECSISRLKIDKSYVDSLMDEKNDESIIKSIVDIGTNMGISVIAEGIEVTEQDEIIKKNSCTKVQGYFYAKPMDADIFEFWYKNYKKLNLTL